MKSLPELKPIPGTDGDVSPSVLAHFIATLANLSERRKVITHKRQVAELSGLSPTHVLRAVRCSIEQGYLAELRRGQGGTGPIEVRQSTFRLLQDPQRIVRKLTRKAAQNETL